MLSRAISSFLRGTAESTLYLIDNSPNDDARKLVNDRRVIYIFNGRNLGFGAAHNIALREAMRLKMTYHLVLNPDVYFDEHVIPRLVQFMNAAPDAGLVMPKILYPDGRLQPLCKLLPGPDMLLLRRFFQFSKSLLERRNFAYELRFTGYDKIMDVPFLSGCFMFLRVDAVRRVGLFDERIFLYTEDLDLSRRIHRDFRTVFYPDAVVYHHHQRGSYHDKKLLLHNIKSAVQYFNKWGWIFDFERRRINQRTVQRLHLNATGGAVLYPSVK
jgi:GT2 family glycosyltransferase